MAIILIVEDGTNVPDANSYVDVVKAREYALQRGIVLPSDDEILGSMLIQGMDYLEAKACEYQGYPTYETQELSWPRKCVIINCKSLAEDAMPKQLIGAQIQLAMAINAGVNIFPNVSASDYITEETIGPITTKYANPVSVGFGDLSPQLTAVNLLIGPLIANCTSSGMSLRSVRV